MHDFCPNCNIDFRGDDIYQHFLDKYTAEWPYKYKKTHEEIFEDIRTYPMLYKCVPDNLMEYSEIEINAWWSASCYGWTVANPQTFRKDIYVKYVGGDHDMNYWKCPNCNYTWGFVK